MKLRELRHGKSEQELCLHEHPSMVQQLVAADSGEAWERLGMEREWGQVAELRAPLRKARAYHKLPLWVPHPKEEDIGTAGLWGYTTVF